MFADTFDTAGAAAAVDSSVVEEGELVLEPVAGAEGAVALGALVEPPQPARPRARTPAAHAAASRVGPRIIGISCSGGVVFTTQEQNPDTACGDAEDQCRFPREHGEIRRTACR
ncbi:hypothetical protein [Pseudonocardia zijingensis]|uniref:hypothetical protein n=1 Tax=Pseudonocardia zijingensis TaxID=153376 RepID=UPI0031DDB9CE